MNLAIVKKAGTAITKVGGRRLLKLRKFAPTGLFVLGSVGLISAGVIACKKSVEASDVISEMNDVLVPAVKERHNNGEGLSPEEYKIYKHELAGVYRHGIGTVARIYLAPVVLAGTSLACLVGSHGMLLNRNANLVNTLNMMSASYANYRDLVKENYGEDVDDLFGRGLGIEKDVEIEEISDSGKKRKAKVDQIVPKPGYSIYARCFDETSSYWQDDAEANKTFLIQQQCYFNDLLRIRGHVFLNEVYDALGFERTSAGATTGWLRQDNGGDDGYISFGMFIDTESKRRFVNGLEKNIWLDFNVDGVIYDLI